jgi:hypothetical protein
VNAEDGGFAQFVEVRQRALQRTAWLLTGDWALAEDLVQTALARSWPRWERIRRRDDPEIYVRRVMVNTWTGWNRRRWRAEHPTGAMPDCEAAGDLAAEVTARIAVRSALGSLTARRMGRPSTSAAAGLSAARSSRSARPPTGPASRSPSPPRTSRSPRTGRPSTPPPGRESSRSARPPTPPASPSARPATAVSPCSGSHPDVPGSGLVSAG